MRGQGSTVRETWSPHPGQDTLVNAHYGRLQRLVSPDPGRPSGGRGRGAGRLSEGARGRAARPSRPGLGRLAHPGRGQRVPGPAAGRRLDAIPPPRHPASTICPWWPTPWPPASRRSARTPGGESGWPSGPCRAASRRSSRCATSRSSRPPMSPSALGLSPGSVKRHLYRAIRHLAGPRSETRDEPVPLRRRADPRTRRPRLDRASARTWPAVRRARALAAAPARPGRHHRGAARQPRAPDAVAPARRRWLPATSGSPPSRSPC